MKYFTLALAALMTATTATAALPTTKGERQANPMKVAKVQKANTSLSINHEKLDLSKLHRTPTTISRADALPIYEVEGDAMSYSVTALMYQYTWFGLSFEEADVMKEVVWGDEGTVYIKNFVPIGVDYYIKGQQVEDKVVVELPQPVYYYADEEGEQLLWLNVMELDMDLDGLYKNVEGEKHEIVMDLDVDGSMSWTLNPDYSYEMFETDSELPQYIVGLTEVLDPGVDDWYGYGDAAQTYTIFDAVEVTPPANAEYDNWVMTYTNTNESTVTMLVDVALAGDEIYLGNLNEDAPGWVKGQIIGDKAYFENGQYMGYNDLYGVNTYFLSGKFKEVYLEEYDVWDLDIEFTAGLTLAYDAEAKSLTAENADDCFVINAKLDELYYFEICINPTIKWQDPALCNANPLNPECLFYQAWDPDYFGGQGAIYWDIPAVNVNGALLDTNRMYYHFLVDGEVYPIDPEEYPYAPEYIEDIPYNYTDDTDIFTWGETHEIYFYFDGAESFGLQSFYVGDNDEVYASEIVTYVPETDGVDSVKFVEVVSTKYVDLMGREVSHPQNGLYIKTMKLADGSTRSVKVMVK